jgi:hypothetical protein
MKIQEQLLRHEIINFVEESIVYKTIFDQLAMNGFQPTAPCLCEIREAFMEHTNDCYDKHMGKALQSRTHLLFDFCKAYYQLLINKIVEEEIDVYGDEVFYTANDGESHSLLSDYLPTRQLVIEEAQEEIIELLYEVMFRELREENKVEEEVKE